MDTVDPELLQYSIYYVSVTMMVGGLAYFLEDSKPFVMFGGLVQIASPAVFAYYSGLWPFYFYSIIFTIALVAALINGRNNEEDEDDA